MVLERSFCCSLCLSKEQNKVGFPMILGEMEARLAFSESQFKNFSLFSSIKIQNMPSLSLLATSWFLRAMSGLERLSSSCPWGLQVLPSKVFHTSWAFLYPLLSTQHIWALQKSFLFLSPFLFLFHSLSWPLSCLMWLFPVGRHCAFGGGEIVPGYLWDCIEC